MAKPRRAPLVILWCFLRASFRVPLVFPSCSIGDPLVFFFVPPFVPPFVFPSCCLRVSSVLRACFLRAPFVTPPYSFCVSFVLLSCPFHVSFLFLSCSFRASTAGAAVVRSNSSVIDQPAANGSGSTSNGTCGPSHTGLLDAAGSEGSEAMKAVAVLLKVEAALGCSTDEVRFLCSKVTVSDRHSKLPGTRYVTALPSENQISQQCIYQVCYSGLDRKLTLNEINCHSSLCYSGLDPIMFNVHSVPAGSSPLH